MGNLHLVTGYAGFQHVTSADQGSFNAAMVGSGQYVMQNGNQFAASVITNNLIKVLDGDILMQGRHIRLNAGSSVELVIENGQQGYLRNDLIAIRYTKDVGTGVEDANLVVIKGTASTSNPKDPAYTSGDIIGNGDTLNDMPLYRVPLNGLNIQELVPLFSAAETAPAKLLEKINRHANQHAKDGIDPITPASIGALATSGGTLTGQLFINNTSVNGFLKMRTVGGVAAQAGFGIANKENKPALSMELTDEATRKLIGHFYTHKDIGARIAGADGSDKALFGEHNKPIGKYTGNGSREERTIATGGIGNMLLIWNDTNEQVVIALPHCGIYTNPDADDASLTVKLSTRISYENGVLTFDGAADTYNADGVVYRYQCI